MGQAIADLPDPLESPSPAEAQSADDLLSQLAGDEIDRLLAESEGDAPPAKPAMPEPPAQPEPVEVAAVTPETPVAAIESAAAPVPPIDLDAVLETAVADHNAAAERTALHGDAFAASQPVDHSPQIDLGAEPRIPLLLRPLEWLSSPLDPWPDQLRDILGKVGLMTLINALAVLAYVLVVRRHHR
jgi:hypothetical protein